MLRKAEGKGSAQIPFIVIEEIIRAELEGLINTLRSEKVGNFVKLPANGMKRGKSTGSG